MLAIPLAADATANPGSHFRLAINSEPDFRGLDATAKRVRYVILLPWQLETLHALKRANPKLNVLLYKDLSFSPTDNGPHDISAGGVSYAEAEAGHPDWFLKDTRSSRFTSGGFDWLWAMDIGSPSYQQRWADNVLAALRAAPWDGVFMDDVNASIKWHHEPAAVAKYPSDARYGAAIGEAVAAIAPRIRAAGKLVFANLGVWQEYATVSNGYLTHLDGAMDEHFGKWGNAPREGYQGEHWWSVSLRNLKYAESLGKTFLALTHSANGDRDAARFGYASMLLATRGRAAFALHEDYGSENWFPEYEYDIGHPVANEKVDGSGVHRRPFSRGLVLVNPTHRAVTVEFGARYSGSGLTNETGKRMKPYSGLILYRRGPDGERRRTRALSRPRASRSIRLVARGRGAGIRLRWRERAGRESRGYVVVKRGPAALRRIKVRARRYLDRRIRAGHDYVYSVRVPAVSGRAGGRSNRVKVRTRSRSGAG
jgi:hypothetical protein